MALCLGLWVSRYQRGETNLDFTEVRDSEWQWHQLGRMQVWTSLQTDNHASIPTLSFLQAACLPATQPTVSKHWRHRSTGIIYLCGSNIICLLCYSFCIHWCLDSSHSSTSKAYCRFAVKEDKAIVKYKKHLKNVGPICYCKPFYIVIHQVSLLPPLLHAACASMSTTTTTRDRGDCYGPMEWAQSGIIISFLMGMIATVSCISNYALMMIQVTFCWTSCWQAAYQSAAKAPTTCL